MHAPAQHSAQNSYEVQVYGAEIVPIGKTMVELRSKFTVKGEWQNGFTPWFETVLYF